MTAPAPSTVDLPSVVQGAGTEAIGPAVPSFAVSILDVFNTYSVIFIAAFLVALLATPIARRLALAANIVDHPSEARKTHQHPTPYLGGVAVLLGLLVAVGVSYVYEAGPAGVYTPVPISIVIGMIAIALTGLADDAWGWDPRLKIAGQLIAAAALSIEEIGVRVAEGLLRPIAGAVAPWLGNDQLEIMFSMPVLGEVSFDVVYWTGTALIAIFVLGGCNAANLIDGLDGLLSGVVGIVAVGLLSICLLMTIGHDVPSADGALAGARFVLCFALLGAVLGFLPHNFNPASIFLGDCGSLLLGYMCVVIILMLGERGQTHLVFAGLIVFAVPIMDTTLAIIRRRVSRMPMSSADDQHIHHQLKRALGGVKRAVFALYGIGLLFAVVGVSLAASVMLGGLRIRIIYVIAVVLFSFIGVIAFKAARRKQLLAATPPTGSQTG
jgi:UDP-GlcNAc:undecaprenyl-phosphate GlcNAc-1-phosphate transferase